MSNILKLVNSVFDFTHVSTSVEYVQVCMLCLVRTRNGCTSLLEDLCSRVKRYEQQLCLRNPYSEHIIVALGFLYCRTPCGDRPPPPRFVAWLCDSVGNCCCHSLKWVIVLGQFLAMLLYMRASCNCHANSCPRACGGIVLASE